MSFVGKSILDRGKSKCKGPEAGSHLMCSMNIKVYLASTESNQVEPLQSFSSYSTENIQKISCLNLICFHLSAIGSYWKILRRE